ncbi:unnamed protein product [Rhizophagus irregularis]|nr:unnamed protein product [Rhizophagus irregularis]
MIHLQIQGWRANVDLIPIFTKQYVSKYASEVEPRSLGSFAFSEVLDKALHALPLQRYCNRPAELEKLSLFKLDQQYKLLKGNWVECSGEYIVRMVRYRDLLSLTENHTLSWIDLYNQHLVEINDDPDDLIGPAVDDIQEVDGNDSDEEITTGVTKACYDIMKLKRQKALSNRQLVATK